MLKDDFIELKRDEVLDTVKKMIEQKEDALKILEHARQAMIIVGDKFQKGTLFLAEMMLAAEIFKKVVAMLKPLLDKVSPPEPIGKMVLATPKGDIHDLGKDIFATLLIGQGFEVHDLGVDVDPSSITDKGREGKPDFVGCSVLSTTAFANMKKTTDMLEKEKLRDSFKLMVGGGVTNSVLKEHISADFQTIDAMEGVDYCLKQIKEKNL